MSSSGHPSRVQEHVDPVTVPVLQIRLSFVQEGPNQTTHHIPVIWEDMELNDLELQIDQWISDFYNEGRTDLSLAYVKPRMTVTLLCNGILNHEEITKDRLYMEPDLWNTVLDCALVVQGAPDEIDVEMVEQEQEAPTAQGGENGVDDRSKADGCYVDGTDPDVEEGRPAKRQRRE